MTLAGDEDSGMLRQWKREGGGGGTPCLPPPPALRARFSRVSLPFSHLAPATQARIADIVRLLVCVCEKGSEYLPK